MERRLFGFWKKKKESGVPVAPPVTPGELATVRKDVGITRTGRTITVREPIPGK